jgi:hypothetical protein
LRIETRPLHLLSRNPGVETMKKAIIFAAAVALLATPVLAQHGGG